MLLEYTLILHCSFHCSFCKVSLVSLPQISGSFYSRAASTSFAVTDKKQSCAKSGAKSCVKSRAKFRLQFNAGVSSFMFFFMLPVLFALDKSNAISVGHIRAA